MKNAKNYFNKTLLIYLTTLGCYIFITILMNTYIFNHDFFAEHYDGILANLITDYRVDYGALNYLLVGLVITFKYLVTIICISVGYVLNDYKIDLGNILEAVVIGEFIFILALGIHFFILLNNIDQITFSNTSDFYPLSLAKFIGSNNIVSWFRYPLQELNLFQIFYIVLVTWLLSKKCEYKFIESLAIVLPSYATGLMLWLVLVTFLTLQVS